MDLLWHLCDIFFLRSPILIATNQGVLNELLDWVEQHTHGATTPHSTHMPWAPRAPCSQPDTCLLWKWCQQSS